MGEAARPFNFDELDASADAPARTYSAAALETAREEARLEALESLIAEETREQTRLAALIAERLEASADAHDAAIAAHVTTLTDTARAIVKHICANAAVQNAADNAAALIDHYLAAVHDRAPARLVLHEDAPQELLSRLSASLTRRDADGVIHLQTSADIAPGDCRIEWRGGAIAYSQAELFTRIDSIFGAVNEESRAIRKGKGQPS